MTLKLKNFIARTFWYSLIATIVSFIFLPPSVGFIFTAICLFSFAILWDQIKKDTANRDGKQNFQPQKIEFVDIDPDSLRDSWQSVEINYFSSSGLNRRGISVVKWDSVYFEGFCRLRNAYRMFCFSSIQGEVINTVTGEVASPSEWMSILHQTEAMEEIFFIGLKAEEKEKLQNLAMKNRFIVRKTVTKNLDYLCKGLGNAPETVFKAKQCGALVISPEEFMEMI